MSLSRRVSHFTAGHATFLGMLITVGLWASSLPSNATPLSSDEFRTMYADQVYEALVDDHKITVVMGGDGRVEINGPIGQFEGSWAMADNLMCVYFASGPRIGETCGHLLPDQSGGFETTTGIIMRPLVTSAPLD
ncbi:hypothetical protein [Actibacterium sp. 188UL27-1]|uniref:hypothetical protein n=1 Tax=Actibacterium sp. 188UL27-1 TaxID=2786961 RepID=UPI001957548D|nr:hypothetical protein [Actibacterium sp. 188UL27-1]MBM7066703.1 hypothetical protein [Actibacterium sp. 188UL27-1]